MGFANLPGQNIDAAARKLRTRIQEGTQTPEEVYTDKIYIDEKGEVDPELLSVELYGLASFVIEMQWADLRAKLPQEGIPLPEKLPAGNPYQFFARNTMQFLAERKEAFVEQMRTRITEPDHEFTRDEAIFLRYLEASREVNRFGVPSMNDLVVLIERIAEVVPKIYQRELGREATAEEIMSTVRDISTRQLFAEIMTNSRALTYPLIARLEGEARPDLDDVTRVFTPDLFDLVEEFDGKCVVRLKDAFVEKYREVMNDYAKRVADNDRTPPRALQCPVLYTPLFKEMYVWVADELERVLVRV